MDTRTLPCPTEGCGHISQATGLLQKIAPPNYEYKCSQGHSWWAEAKDAERRVDVVKTSLPCQQCDQPSLYTGECQYTDPGRYGFKCSNGHYQWVPAKDSVVDYVSRF